MSSYCGNSECTACNPSKEEMLNLCPGCYSPLMIFHDRATCSGCKKKFALRKGAWQEINWISQKTSGGHKFKSVLDGRKYKREGME